MIEREIKGEVLLIAEDETAVNYRWGENYPMMKPQLQVIPYTVKDDILKDVHLETASIGSQIVPGMMFAKHPYKEKTFVEISSFEKQMILYKQNRMMEIARELNAKRIEMTVELIDAQERKNNFKAKGGYGLVKANFNYHNEEVQKKCQSYYKEKCFEGLNGSAEKAKEIAMNCGLQYDEDVMQLIEDRMSGNKLTNQTIRILLSNETTSATDIAFSATLIGTASLDANYQSILSKREEFRLVSRLEF